MPDALHHDRNRPRRWRLAAVLATELVLTQLAPSRLTVADQPRMNPFASPPKAIATNPRTVHNHASAFTFRPASATQRPSSRPSRLPSSSTPSAAATVAPATMKSRRPAQPKSWLPSGSAYSKSGEARKLLNRAVAEYGSRAWASSEATTWSAIAAACQGLDRQSTGDNHQASASRSLAIARETIIEAADFLRSEVAGDSAAMKRIIRAHQTTLLKEQPSDQWWTASQAADIYFNDARRRLGELASRDLEVARGLDLLAAIWLAEPNRGAHRQATALCLRRAAFQGQPANATLAEQLGRQLAEAGLFEESAWALQSVMELTPNPQTAELLAEVSRLNAGADRRRFSGRGEGRSILRPPSRQVPDIVNVAPAEFAATFNPGAVAAPTRGTARVATQPGLIALPMQSSSDTTPGTNPSPRANPLRQVFDTMGRLW